MVDTKSKTKSAMLLELESIKGLLLEEDEIPILQEVIEQPVRPKVTTPISGNPDLLKPTSTNTNNRYYSEQPDFFNANSEDTHLDLLDTISDLEKMALEKVSPKTGSFFTNTQFSSTNPRPALAKATGENPFLPEHIRSRLHGNNPPPLFETETAKKIASVAKPSTFLGNTTIPVASEKPFGPVTARKIPNSQQELIDDVMDHLLPEIERELRERLEHMSKETLERLLDNKR